MGSACRESRDEAAAAAVRAVNLTLEYELKLMPGVDPQIEIEARKHAQRQQVEARRVE